MRLKYISLPLIALVVSASTLISIPKQAKAVSAADWKPGRIIDDAIFLNKDSMSVQQIQDFLNAKVPNCDRWNPTRFTYAGKPYGPPYTCLKEYQENPTTKENNIGRFNPDGSPYNVPGGWSAAQIIKDASNSHGINPQVLIVMLQKETAIVTDTWAAGWQYDRAMGYGCPDSGPNNTANCNASYYGFYNQVGNAAWQLKNPVYGGYGITKNIMWQVGNVCGSSPVYIENFATASLYSYTPYQPNQAALNNLYGSGDGCSAYGNRNFWRLFNDWFGTSRMPQIVRNPGGSVFMLSSGYKFYIPNEAILRDFGTDPSTVATIPDSYLNNIPWANTQSGQSGNLSYLVKTTSDSDGDGPTLYAVTAGKKYSVISMQQFTNFSFNLNEISYLPESLVASIPLAGNLSNFLQSPTNNAFMVNNGQKNIILDGEKYIELNPSNKATFSSYFFVNRLVSGSPITDTPLLLRYSSGAVAIYGSDKYYPISSLNTYLCWGLDQGTAGKLYQLADDSYATPINQTLIQSCAVQDIAGNKYLLNKKNKVLINDNPSIPSNSYSDSRIDQIISKLPTLSSPLTMYVKSDSNPGIWAIVNNQKRLVPSMQNFNLLKLNTSNMLSLDQSLLDDLPTGDAVLGKGLAVKSPDNATVYAIDTNERIAYQSAEQFLAFGNDWNQIETYNSETLNRLYPDVGKNIQSFIINKSNSQVFLIDKSGCYIFDDQMLVRYGKSRQLIDANQNYSYEVYAKLNLNNCKIPSRYIKSSARPVVYKIENGVKSAFSDWNSLLQDNGGSVPTITVLADEVINSIN